MKFQTWRRQDLTPAGLLGALDTHGRSLWNSLRALGWPGGLAALCLALAGVLAQQLTPRWQAQTEEWAAQEARLRRGLRSQAAVAAAAESPAALLETLPPAHERQQRLADLLEIGLRLGLVQQRSEQRVNVDAPTGLERLRVHMPVQGSYAQLRQYLGAALAHDPALSLDVLRLRRPQRESPMLQAELVWTLHSRREPGSPP